MSCMATPLPMPGSVKNGEILKRQGDDVNSDTFQEDYAGGAGGGVAYWKKH